MPKTIPHPAIHSTTNHANAYQRPMGWFRLYSEFADDPKVQTMSEAMQRRFVMLMCSHCKGEKISDGERAFLWRISAEELAATKTVFLEKGFIDENWNLVNWNRRQFISDSSTERTRQYRRRLKQEETSRERHQSQSQKQIQKQSQRAETETNPPARKRAGGGVPPWRRLPSRIDLMAAMTFEERLQMWGWTEEQWVDQERNWDEMMAHVNGASSPEEEGVVIDLPARTQPN